MIDIGNLVILGDSYSTFSGFVPEGYAAYYTKEGPHYLQNEEYAKMEVCESENVNCPEQTWWGRLISATNANLILNNSYSGTTICNTGYDGADCKEISFNARLDRLIEEDYFVTNKVDTLIIFGGTNDSWANSPIGELKFSDWEPKDLYSVLPAVGYVLSRAAEKLKSVRTICVLNSELKDVISDAIRTACKKYNIDLVELKDIKKICGHPTVTGMEQISEQILNYLK